MNSELIVENILKYTGSGTDYKSFCLVSRIWYQIAARLFRKGYVFRNDIAVLLELFPNENWDPISLSSNPLVNWGIVQANPQIKWRKEYLYMNLPWNVLLENIDIADKWFYLSSRVPWSFIKANPLYSWHIPGVSINPNITWDIVCENRYIYSNSKKHKWNYRGLSAQKFVTPEIVESTPGKSWDIVLLAHNKNFKLKDIKRINGKHRLYELYSTNPNVTYEYVKRKANKPWNYFELYKRGVIPLEECYTPNKNIFWTHPDLTWKWVLEHNEIKWDYESLSWSVMPWYVAKDNPEYHEGMSANSNITWQIVVDNFYGSDGRKLWNFDNMSENTFGKKHRDLNDPLC